MDHTYSIYYELNNPQIDYPILQAYLLQTFSISIRVGEKMWFVNSTNPASVIRTGIINALGPGGKILIVFNVGTAWAIDNLPQNVDIWLQNNWNP